MTGYITVSIFPRWGTDILKNTRVHFLSNSVVLPTDYLEGDYDVIWTNLIDNAFVSPHGRLHRKEKASTLSACKFDGLYIGGRIEPQEWLVIEVGRTTQISKQTKDRQKLVEHCLRILNYRRWYLGIRANLHGQALVSWLEKFPVWGIQCRGPEIEIMRFCWLTRGLGVVTTFASAFPNHVTRLQSLYGILGEIHCAAVSYRSECVEALEMANRYLGVREELCWALGYVTRADGWK